LRLALRKVPIMFALMKEEFSSAAISIAIDDHSA
jgi:hypothetical protein